MGSDKHTFKVDAGLCASCKRILTAVLALLVMLASLFVLASCEPKQDGTGEADGQYDSQAAEEKTGGSGRKSVKKNGIYD